MIAIIGAGPVGSYLAYLLAKNGKEVEVYEEHSSIGKPIQCTGILTNGILDLMDIDEKFVDNVIRKARIFSPDGKFVDFNINDNFIVNRTKFDSFLADKAKKLGVKYYTDSKFLDCDDKDKVKFRIENKGKIVEKEADVLVGADGVYSKVAKSVGLYEGRKFFIGMQARVKGKFDSEVIEFYTHHGCFAWLVPEGKDVVRLGIASFDRAKEYFDGFFKQRVKDCELIEYQSGLIPVYDPNLKISKGNVYLIGDAATQVKATTAGGIVPGMIAAKDLTKVLVEGKGDYGKLVRKSVGRKLWLNLVMRKMMDNFSKKDYNKLVNLFNQKRLKSTMLKYDRDNIIKLSLALLVREPRLLGYSSKLFW